MTTDISAGIVHFLVGMRQQVNFHVHLQVPFQNGRSENILLKNLTHFFN